MKKIIGWFLICVVVLPVFGSCKTGEKATVQPRETVANADPSGKTEPENGEKRIYPELEAQDFDGYEFKFLTRSLSSNPDWAGLDHT